MMPVPPRWLPRLPQILDEARVLTHDLDRDQVMQLFGLSRREALRLMKRLNPRMELGRWWIDRRRVVQWLEQRQQDAERENRRRERLTRGLMAADLALPRPAGAFLSVAATEEMRQASQGLPEGVRLLPGKLEVEFSTLEELAKRLLETGFALDRNFEHYAAATEPDSEELRQRELERQDAEYFKNWKP
jgi:hypothetical protein